MAEARLKGRLTPAPSAGTNILDKMGLWVSHELDALGLPGGADEPLAWTSATLAQAATRWKWAVTAAR
eukprot:4976929-Prymnesium_polylepis.1